MLSFILETTRRLLSPHHELSCSWLTWRRLLRELRRSGGHGARESGAFLLGRACGTAARIEAFVLYDELDPHCLDSGIVRFDGRHFGALWHVCRQRGLTVVADVHTHPGAELQSESDRNHPMIARAGHLALILPNYARGATDSKSVGIYRYAGSKRWRAVPVRERRAFLHIGL